MRAALMRRLPAAWQPVAAFHYYRLRALLEPELHWLCAGLDAGQRVVDVGANEGVFTHAFARIGARVEAFEPLPSCAAVLRGYAARRPTVHVHEIALGAEAGRSVLRVPLRGGRAVSGHASLARTDIQGEQYDVAVRTLDSFGFEDVRAIKIDVEGHELEVVRGAANTIRRGRPLLLVEIEQRHQRVPLEAVFAEIGAMGYSGSFLHPSEGERPLSEFRADVHQAPENADRLGALYINNFMFTPVAAG